MNRLISLANIILLVLLAAGFTIISEPCNAAMEAMEDTAMEKMAAARGSIANFTDRSSDVKIKMRAYGDKKSSNRDAGFFDVNTGRQINTVKKIDKPGFSQSQIISQITIQDSMPFGSVPLNPYAKQLVSNLSIGMIPGLSSLFDPFTPGIGVLAPGLIRNLSFGLTPVGMSFGSLVTQGMMSNGINGFDTITTGITIIQH